MVSETSHVVEHGTSKSGRWLRARRFRIALVVAAFEAILVAVFNDASRWTVVGIAVAAVLLYWYTGRNSRSDTYRQVTWIVAVSQLAAVLAVVLAVLLLWTAILAAVVFAGIALFIIVTDRR
jgi:hypothetical protein